LPEGHDADGAVRTVYGIASSVTLGDAEIAHVQSAACGKMLCLAKTDTTLVSASGSVDAPSGPALFAFDGNRAFVWFPAPRQLAQWQGDTLNPIESSVDGEVLSIRANAGAIQFAVRRATGVWIVGLDGSVIAGLPPSAGPVILIPGGAVYATRTEIVIRDVRIPLTGVVGFLQMSAGHLQVRAHGISYALRIETGREMLFQLPGVAQ
jgi:hypothetical protein